MTQALSSNSALASQLAGGDPPSRAPASALSVAFTMPTPPSANHLFKNVPGKGRVKSHHYDDFLRMAINAIRLQNVQKLTGNVVVVIGVERMSGNADIDNRLKAAMDSIVAAGIIEDDRFVTAIAVSWLPKANGLAHVQIHQVRQIDLSFQPSHNGTSGGWFIRAINDEEPET